MTRFRSRKVLVIAVAALAVAAGGGAAIAASEDSSPSPRSFFDAVAKHLGISSEKLEDATKAAAIDQVDAALEAGRITKAQADELKERIESGEHPPFFGPFFFGPGVFHGGPHLFGDKLSTAADYLGLTQAELREKLSDGQTLAEVAESEGKSVDGLKQAILDDARERIAQAVDDGELTQAQADEMLEHLKARIDDLVDNATFRFHFRRGLGRPPDRGPLW